MKYRVRHETRYDYDDPVSISHHILRITPRTFGRQVCDQSEISVFPVPSSRTIHSDYFGNPVTTFTLIEPHERITIDAVSSLEVNPPAPVDFSASPAWEVVRDSLYLDHSPEGLAAYQFVFDSKRAESRPELAEYASASFPSGCPLLEGMLELTRRINRDFRFDSTATDISTPVETFFEKRRGVCQDFSHLQIACMRSLGLPARYVSGYLRTLPPPGEERLVGADASHAWCATWTPSTGWVDFDPTNNCVPRDGHITVAWGRDYGDVSPVYGVLLGGSEHTLHVGVDVLPIL
jgi:transglutaminase-like putative cysteine protease